MKRADRDAQRLALLREGLSIAEIAERTGKTRQAIHLWRQKIDLTMPAPSSLPKPKTRKQRTHAQKIMLRRERYDRGDTGRQMADAEGTQPQTICAWRLDNELPPNDGPRAEQAARNVERNAEILKARAEGMRLTDIGARFGISRERVRQILVSLDAPVVSVSGHSQRREAERHARFLPMYECGSLDEEIAAACGCPLSAVQQWRSRNHLPTNAPPVGDPEVAARNQRLFADHLAGASRADLAEKYGISLPRVDQIVDFLGDTSRHRERNAEVRRLYHGERIPLQDLAPRLGLSVARLRQIAGPRWAWIAANPTTKETP